MYFDSKFITRFGNSHFPAEAQRLSECFVLSWWEINMPHKIIETNCYNKLMNYMCRRNYSPAWRVLEKTVYIIFLNNLITVEWLLEYLVPVGFPKLKDWVYFYQWLGMAKQHFIVTLHLLFSDTYRAAFRWLLWLVIIMCSLDPLIVKNGFLIYFFQLWCWICNWADSAFKPSPQCK